MGKSRTAALMIAVLIIGLGVGRTATASHQASHKAFSGGATFKGLVVKTQSVTTGVTTTFPSWELIDSRGFEIPAGDSQLVVVDFFAQTFCAGTGDSCFARVLIGRTLGTAQEAEPAGATVLDVAGSDDVEGHAMSRALCVRNATSSPLDISVFVEATRGASVSTFSMGSYTLKIARNSTCSPAMNI